MIHSYFIFDPPPPWYMLSLNTEYDEHCIYIRIRHQATNMTNITISSHYVHIITLGGEGGNQEDIDGLT